MASERPPKVVRRGTRKDKNLRTYITANGRDIMGSTQGYDNNENRQNADELALTALFNDPKLQPLVKELMFKYLHKHHMMQLDFLWRWPRKTSDG